MTRTSEPGLLAGARKLARPWCTAMATGLPTHQNASAVVSFSSVCRRSTHPPERTNPTTDAKTQGHTRSPEPEFRTNSGRHDELRRTELPAVAAIVTQRE